MEDTNDGYDGIQVIVKVQKNIRILVQAVTNACTLNAYMKS